MEKRGIVMKDKLIELGVILGGNLVLAFATACFILPYNIVTGGVAGVAVVLEPLFGIPAQWTINGIVGIMFVIGTIFLGRDFAMKTIISSIAYPLFLNLIMALPLTMPQDMDPILASLYGGIFTGIGVGLVMRMGASTGGMDIPPLVIHKFTNLPLSQLVFVTDVLTVALGLIAYGINNVLIGLISVYVGSRMIDAALTFGAKHSKSLEIISSQYEKMLPYIHDNLYRGTTLIEAQGGFTGDKKKILLTAISSNQYNSLMQYVYSVDKEAFVIVHDVLEVKGYGFTYGE